MQHGKFAALAAFFIGALSGSAHAQDAFDVADFRAELSGASEVPPVVTDATGEAKFRIVGVDEAIDFELEVEQGTDLLGFAGAHIHCAPAGENGPVVVFLAGLVPGGFDGKLEIKATIDDDNIINDACGETLAELIAEMIEGNTYVNVHTPTHEGGEIRGQIMPE